MGRKLALIILAWAFLCNGVFGQSREQKVRDDKKKIEGEGYWLYNDLTSAKEQAKKQNKPIIVVLRCVPCEECVKLDDELVNQDPQVRSLLENFIRVRIVGTNGLDLSTFQFDYDQSFAVFFLNADGTIYGRFGTRSHRTHWADDVSIAGLGKAMEAVLDLHKGYPENALALSGKKGPKPLYTTPEKFPLHQGKFTSQLDYQGNVVKSCIHCHQIGDAIRQDSRDRGEPISSESLYPYPHPKSLGFIFDPKECATLARVEEGSLAQNAGFQKGDKLLTLEGQPVISLADLQWILHHTPIKGKTLIAKIGRSGKELLLELLLPDGWKKKDDTSWRVSTWGMRRMATGGLVLESITGEEKSSLGIPVQMMGLRVKHVGQYGEHAAAMRAGFKKDDILLSFDGEKGFLREQDLIEYSVTRKKVNDKVPVSVLRNGKQINLILPMQK